MRNEKKYRVTLKYSENTGRHTIEETWECRSLKSVKKVLCEALDMYRDGDGDGDGDGNPAEPDLEKLKANLGRYADDKFVEQEFRRMDKACDVYACAVKNISDIMTGFIIGPVGIKVDRRTEIVIDAK